MEKKTENMASNTLTILVTLTVSISVLFSFYKYYIQNDYSLYVKESCDPSTEECLSEECEAEDPRCTPSEDGLMYYKELYIETKDR